MENSNKVETKEQQKNKNIKNQKKENGKVKNIQKINKKINRKDIYHRITYLHQVGSFFAAQSPELQVLSRHHVKTMKQIAKKNVIRMSPHLKRNCCKKCNSILIPGRTSHAEIENKSKKQKSTCDVLVITCLTCDETKRFPIGKDKNYKLWADKAVIE